ncbi:hypothetical protein E5163_16125 [Marinicauda algicola]|uniref:Uncharacterized protein n=1 Tax=Marinicauda algicola TaxID=2029849 RepID=A0A4S2GWN1_9PROT|nr:hypothetical protein [Marinicauda algicola]TGY87241.1 hypothetical protein E5163_16125 [Marinicauda algicola]
MNMARALIALAAWGQLVAAGALSVALAETEVRAGGFVDLLPLALLAGAGITFYVARLVAGRV